MSDLRTALERRSARGVPIGSEQLRQRVALELAAPIHNARTPSSGWVVALATAAVVLVVIGGLALLFGGSEGSAPPADDSLQVPPPTTQAVETAPVTTDPPVDDTAPVAPTTVTSTTVAWATVSGHSARVAALPFDFADHDLCEWFTPGEILAIVADAYEAEGVDYPLPDTLVAEPVAPDTTEQWAAGFAGRPGCDWTVPGTPWGWGRDDFTVMFRDDSDVTLATKGAPTMLESYHDPSSESYVQPLHPELLEDMDVLDLVIPGVVDVGGWSPGFGVYVEKADRVIDFRHDLARSVQPRGQPRDPWGAEEYRIEYRILTSMLERMNWLPTTGADE